jgi:nucleotide-binding universal stress UspA family protein
MEGAQELRFVVVGFDGSASSEAALSWAIDDALRRQLPLRVVHVESAAAQNDSAGRELVDAHVRRAIDAGVRAEAVVQAGDPTQVLLEQARDAALVVVGAIGRAGPQRLRLGTVADRLIQRAGCPVVVTPESRNVPAGGPVVVGLDATGGSSRALAFAFEEAALSGLSLITVTAQPDADLSPAPESGPPDLGGTRIDTHDHDLQMLQHAYPSVIVSSRVAPGGAVRILLEQGRDADLLVVGARRHDAVVGLSDASVSHALLLDATSPVAIVRD